MIDVRVQLCVLTIAQGQLSVVVARNEDVLASQPTRWTLLGSPLDDDADADATALRLLSLARPPRLGGDSGSVLGSDDPARFPVVEQLRTYSEVQNKQCRRIVSVAYFALLSDVSQTTRVSDSIRVFAVDDLLAEPGDFGDADLLNDAVERVRSKFEYTTIATSLLPEPFTIPELRRVYEAVWGTTLHPANFRRKVLATDGFVIPVGDAAGRQQDRIQDRMQETKGPDLFGRGKAALLHPAMLRSVPT
jgi:8-oxo-dGTP diphosphatase